MTARMDTSPGIFNSVLDGDCGVMDARGLTARSLVTGATAKDQSRRGNPCSVARSFRGAQMAGEAALAAAAQRAEIIGVFGIVGVTDEVGNRRIAQHASAIGQRRAGKAQHLSVGEVDV